jgi:glutaredoxin
MVELPYISPDDGVILYSLPNCPNCMALKDKLNMSKIKYRTLMMDTPEGITELRVGGCFAMMAPVLQVNDTFYENLFD